MDETDPPSLPEAHELHAEARRLFPRFYGMADAREKGVLDSLVLAHASLREGMRARRSGLEPEDRGQLERLTDEAERLFLDLRDQALWCPSLVEIPDEERARLEARLFNAPVPDA